MATLTLPAAAAFSSYPVLKKPHQLPRLSHRNLSFKISCKANDNDVNEQKKPHQPMLDRRNVLVGLSGATLVAGTPLASAAPFLAPDLTKCGPSTTPLGDEIPCCPPETTKVIDYKPPKFSSTRIRPAAHLADKKYMDKFERAIKLMKELPDSDPRSFSQQDKVHCAYCNGAYEQVGFPDLNYEVHNSWIFFPWHRWYLYFFERILGKLVDDPNFATPFWAWDNPAGYEMPARYVNPNSPLYDDYRNPDHQPPALIDYDLIDRNPKDIELLIKRNFATMYRQVVSSGTTAKIFMGAPFRPGDKTDPGAGLLENTPHGTVHGWCGDPARNRLDMGNLFSSGRDPLFYAHHGNVDRVWSIWKTVGGKRKDFKDPDWLNSEFVFYDEEARLVKVKIKDCLDLKNLGYDYQKIDIPWLKSKPKPRTSKAARKVKKAGVAMAAETTKLPIKLDKIVRVKVPRPKQSRSQTEKDEEEEILVIDGIEVDRKDFIKFDVYINDEDETDIGPDNSEFAGSFVNVPRKNKKDVTKTKTCLRLGIAELLEDLGAEDDDGILVTFVPREGTGDVTISAVKIEFDS